MARGKKIYFSKYISCLIINKIFQKAKKVISLRISRAREKDQGCHDIRYNLMSVVPSRKMRIRHELNRIQSELFERLRVINKLGLSANEADLEELNKGTGLIFI